MDKTTRIKAFMAFVKKESLHILRDPRTMLLVIGIPIIQLILFGFALSNEINNITFAVDAPHHTEDIRRSIDRLSHNDYFTFYGYVSHNDADDLLRRGKCDVVVQYDDHGHVHLAFDASNPNTAVAGSGYLRQALSEESTASSPFISHVLFNPQMRSAYTFVPGIMGMIFLIICAIMTSVSIVREKETGTMEVLLVSPVKPIAIIFAKMIPYLVLSCIDLSIILLLSKYLLDVPVENSLSGIIAMTLLYIFLSLSLGLLISTATSKQVVALLISGMMLIFPTVMLSGMVFPVSNMPQALQWLSSIIPARWYIDAMRKLMIEGLSFARVLSDAGILTAMTLLILAVALKNFKKRLE